MSVKKEEPIEIRIDLIHLGLTVAKFSLPMKLIDDINKLYDKNLKKLKPHNEQLAGKIAEENKVDEILSVEMKKQEVELPWTQTNAPNNRAQGLQARDCLH